METMNNYAARRKAEKRVHELSGFYSHLLTYCVVNAGLFLINYFAGRECWWSFWPMFGWGIGLACHGLRVWRGGFWGDAWRERKHNEFLSKERKVDY
jgi:hypothetical protein